ncbi:MAG: polymorphic toxin-type HINT domain-containing protein [Chloroflexota bacterium]
MVWAIAEIALQVYDTYETAQTVLDPCASLVEKGIILGLYVFGLALPGGGYSTAGKTGIRSVKRLDQADDFRQTFKLVDQADDTRAATRIGDDVDEIDTIKVVDDLCFNSFSAETLVSTEDGLRPISEIAIGDRVWAYDEATDEHGLFPVTDVIVHTDPTQVHLLLDGELLETTPEHPFYTLERGWVDAGDLWVGAHIRQADGSYGRVQFLAVEREDQVMYNLTVDEAHTFFVGAQRWLVHNADCDEFTKRLTNGAIIMAELDKDDIFWLALEVPEAFKRQGIGKQLFNEAWEDLGRHATAIGGKWNTAMPDNLNSFNKALNENPNLSPEEAALNNTFTGRMAQARGFTRVAFPKPPKGTRGAYTDVEVVFRR